MKAFGKRIGGGRRSAARETAPLFAVLTTIQQSKTAILVDVSAAGARLRGHDLPLRGTEVLLSIDQVRAFGTIIWADGGECGVAFDCPLASDEEAHLRVRVDEARGLPPDMKAALDNWSIGCGR